MADCYRKSGQPERAIEHYQTALRMKPDYMPAYLNLAQTLALVGRSQDAIAIFGKGSGNRPYDWPGK